MKFQNSSKLLRHSLVTGFLEGHAYLAQPSGDYGDAHGSLCEKVYILGNYNDAKVAQSVLRQSQRLLLGRCPSDGKLFQALLCLAVAAAAAAACAGVAAAAAAG